MIAVLCNWLYISLIGFPIGFFILSAVGDRFHYQFKSMRPYLWAGIVFHTVYAQFFSLFMKVGLWANVILMILSLAAFVFSFKKLKKEFAKKNDAWKNNKIWLRIFVGIIAGLAILFTAYGTSRGYMAYDTALYHAQAIRWIEEYGVVKGLGLFHCRFAYNSASFALSALFSGSFLPIEPLHTVSGYFVLLLSLELTELPKAIACRKVRFPDILRMGIIYYYSVAFRQMVAPASDFPATVTVIYLVLQFAYLIDEKEENTTPYSLLCVLAVYAVTLKLSAGLFILLTIYSIIRMIQKKESKRIPFYIGVGVLILIPFLIRGVLISGWLLYPSTSIDLFDVAWKIPKEAALADMAEIQKWGRNLQYVTEPVNGTFGWVKSWFLFQNSLVKMMLLLDVAGLFFGTVGIILSVIRKKAELSYVVLFVTLYISTAYWFLSAPLVRYGYAYVILPFLVAFGYYLGKWEKGFPILLTFCILFILYKMTAVGIIAYSDRLSPFYIKQQGYEEYEVTSYEVDGVTLYAPVNGDQTGYECFPSAPFEFKGRIRNGNLKDGFMP